MIEELALVIQVEHEKVWVSPQILSGCGVCTQKSSCSSSLGEGLLKPRLIAVESRFPLVVGDKVIVAIDESRLLKSALWLYVFPLLAMFVGAGMAESVMAEVKNAENYIVVAGLGSLFFALGLLHALQRNGLLNAGVKATVVKKI